MINDRPPRLGHCQWIREFKGEAIRVMIMVSNLQCSAISVSERDRFELQYVGDPGNNISKGPHNCFLLERVRAAR